MFDPQQTQPSAPKQPPSSPASEFELIVSEKTLAQGEAGIRDVIAPASMRIQPDHLELNGLHTRTLFVTTFPRYISVGWFSPIINLSATMDIALFFYPVSSDLILNQLKKKVGNLEAQLIEDKEKGAPRDPLRETALRDIEQLRDAITQGVEHFFQHALYVTLYAPSKKALDQLTENVELLFGSKMVATRRALWQMEQGFNSTLPLANDELGVSVNLNTSPAASSFPFVSSDLTSDSGIL
ncbi:MAG: conjugal transfer protein TraC, partial [Parcubacteria group bacterium]|nr:conjugal transfer protein TraC [Parcubacteria group bacterium]